MVLHSTAPCSGMNLVIINGPEPVYLNISISRWAFSKQKDVQFLRNVNLLFLQTDKIICQSSFWGEGGLYFSSAQVLQESKYHSVYPFLLIRPWYLWVSYTEFDDPKCLGFSGFKINPYHSSCYSYFIYLQFACNITRTAKSLRYQCEALLRHTHTSTKSAINIPKSGWLHV